MTRTALRRMGNSTGMILPRAILGQIGATIGAAIDLRVENGSLIATPVRTEQRADWAAAAADIAAHADEEAGAWQDFGHEGDVDLTW